MIRRRMRALVLAGAVMTALAVPAVPASAQGYDCRILGPAYVAEIKDCVYYILVTTIDPPS